MAIKVKGVDGNPSDRKAKEAAYRSAASSSRQRLFQSALNQSMASGNSRGKQEINSLQRHLHAAGPKLEPMRHNSQDSDRAKTSPAPQVPTQRGLNDLATSALLQLTALAPRARHWNGQIMKAMAPSATAPAGSRAAYGAPTAAPAHPEGREVKGRGELSARFESGEKGLKAIGYDDRGGTSYGIYQISSRAGTMQRFIEYLDEEAPRWGARLKGAGPANTGGRTGGMPAEWKRIAEEEPERFTKLQHDFIEKTHYEPALEAIRERTGIDIEEHSKALQEVLWSTAVQHGPRGAASIFCKAIDRAKAGGGNVTAGEIIDSVYSSRARQFGPSRSDVRAAVQTRFKEERALARAMLAGDTRGASLSDFT